MQPTGRPGEILTGMKFPPGCPAAWSFPIGRFWETYGLGAISRQVEGTWILAPPAHGSSPHRTKTSGVSVGS